MFRGPTGVAASLNASAPARPVPTTAAPALSCDARFSSARGVVGPRLIVVRLRLSLTSLKSSLTGVRLGSLTSLSLTASLTRSFTQCRLKGGDQRLQASHAGIEIDESKGWR
jgi:hypothetical protein